MLHLLQIPSFSRFRTLGSSHSCSCPPCCVLLFLRTPHLPTLCLPPWTPPDCLPPLCYLAHLASPLLMQHSRPTLLFKSLFPLPPISYFLPLHPHYRLMFLAIFLYTSCFLFLSRFPQGSSVECWRSSCQEH